MFKRKIYNQMLEWKKTSAGKTALLIEGARRIGKSTTAEAFARNEYRSYILIDFSIAPSETIRLFDDLSDLNYIFLQLQLQYRVNLYERNSLIIFDEVQFCPRARQAIKFLVKDHRYDYMETGSLISIRKNVENILIPSEEKKIQMYPMDFEEFLLACGDETTYPLIRQCYENFCPLGQDMNRKLMRTFRLYMLVGGMPQAVDAYLKTNNLKEVDGVKRDILSLYEDDFMKIDPTGRASLLFDSIPAQLSKNTARYNVSGVISGARYSDEMLRIIAEMKSSKTVLISYHANDPDVGLSSNEDLSKFKMFLGDTGLFVTLMFKDRDFTENDIYQKLLNDKLSANLGYLYENVTAQILTANGNKLFYYTYMNKTSKHNYEVDFLIARKYKICPIEVKSSGYKTHKSLDEFSKKYSSRILNKYLVYTKDLSKDQDIICLPVYMLPFI